MPDERTTGLILRTRLLTETSLIVQWLTPDLGRIATVAKGARRPKSPFRGKLDLFYVADLSFARSRRSELHTLREVVLRDTHPSLRTELGYLQQASYCATLIEQTTVTESPITTIHELFAGLLKHLPTAPPRPRTIYAFELKLLHELGLQPDTAKTRLGKTARELVEALTTGGWSALRDLKPTATVARELHQFLHGFLIYHLGKIPSGRTAALNVE